jgi:hypothetical protein
VAVAGWQWGVKGGLREKTVKKSVVFLVVAVAGGYCEYFDMQ